MWNPGDPLGIPPVSPRFLKLWIDMQYAKKGGYNYQVFRSSEGVFYKDFFFT